MKVLITQKTKITSKKGANYVIVRGIAEDGGTVEAFLGQEQIDKFQPDNLEMMSDAERNDIFSDLKTVDMQFDQRGRLVNID